MSEKTPEKKRPLTEEELIERIAAKVAEKIGQKPDEKGKLKGSSDDSIQYYSVCTRCGRPFTREENDRFEQCPECGNEKVVKLTWLRSE